MLCSRSVSPPEPNPLLADNDWLRERLNNQATLTEIAEQAGCSEATVRIWVKRHGLSDVVAKNWRTRPRGERYRYPELHDPDWLANRANTHTTREIAAELGCNTAVVRRALHDHQITANSTRVRLAELLTPERLSAQRAAGMSQTQIAAEANCSPSTVSRALKRHGIN